MSEFNVTIESGSSKRLPTAGTWVEKDIIVTATGGGSEVVLQSKAVTPSKSVQEVVADANYTGLEKVTVAPIPDEYIIPSGTKSITENGTHDVTEYASVEVDVATSGGDTLQEFLSWRNGQYLCAYCSTLTSVPLFDTSKVTDMRYMFNSCNALTTVPAFDTSKVTDMSGMFYSCSRLTSVPLFDTSKVTNMSGMFYSCSRLTSVPLFDTSKVTNMKNMFNSCNALTTVPAFDIRNVTDMSNMFQSCSRLTSVLMFDTRNVTNMSSMFQSCSTLTTVPLFDTRNVTNMSGMFYYCSQLTSVPAFDIRNVTNASTMFYDARQLTDVRLRNIKVSLTVGSASYGLLLTVDSLTHLIYELRDTGSSKTLTVGAANLEKLANVYVKAIAITDEMRAEDDLIDEKYPFVVCESTDEGAMLITDYATTVKNWTIK